MKANDRYAVLKAMHDIVCHMNNEEAYMVWIYLIPDQCDGDELREIANDVDEFRDAVKCFRKLMREYGTDGFFVGGELYGND